MGHNEHGIGLHFALNQCGTDYVVVVGEGNDKRFLAGMESNADGAVAGSILEAEVFTAQDLGNGFLLANGSWTQRDASGARVDGGLWGNVFQVVDREVLLHLESTSRNSSQL